MDIHRMLKLSIKENHEGIAVFFNDPPPFFRTSKGREFFAEGVGELIATLIAKYEDPEECTCGKCQERRRHTKASNLNFEVNEDVIANSTFYKNGLLMTLKDQPYIILEVHEDGRQVKIFPETGDPVFVPKSIFNKKS